MNSQIENNKIVFGVWTMYNSLGRMELHMDNEGVTLGLTGEVSLADYAKALMAFKGLIEVIQDKVLDGKQTKWIIEDLQGGSATTVLKGRGEEAAINRVADYYQETIEQYRSNRADQIDSRIRKQMDEIRSLINGSIDSVVFSSGKHQITFTDKGDSPDDYFSITESFGAIRGIIHAASELKGLAFNLYDDNFGRRIPCTALKSMQEDVREALFRKAIVEGWIQRNPLTGEALKIKATSIQVIKDSLNWRDAIGALPYSGKDSPEERIRKGRE